MPRTIKTILSEIKDAVEQNKTLSPNDWINWALELNGLWSDLKTELVKSEILYTQELAKLMTDGEMTKAKAEIVVKAQVAPAGEMSAYEKYRYMLGRDKIIEEFIKLAKKRATLESDFS